MGKTSRFAKGVRRRQKKQAEDATGSGGIFRSDVDFVKWKPGKGQHLIDIVPYFAGKNDYPECQEDGTYVFSFGVHYQVGIDKKTYVCPRTIPGAKDKRCPICEHMAKLKNEGEDYMVYIKYSPKTRELYNVVVQDSQKEKDKGVQVFEVSDFYMGKKLEPIMKKPIRPGEEVANPYIDFAIETKDGKTVAFEIGEKKVPKKNGQGTDTYPEYFGHRLLDRDYDIEEYLDDAYKLDELLYVPTYDEIYAAFWDSSAPEEENKEEKKPLTLRERKNRNKKKEEEKESTPDPEENTSKQTEDFSDIDTDSMNRKELKVFIKKNSIPLDPDLGEDLKDYDDEDLRFLIEDWIEENK